MFMSQHRFPHWLCYLAVKITGIAYQIVSLLMTLKFQNQTKL